MLSEGKNYKSALVVATEHSKSELSGANLRLKSICKILNDLGYQITITTPKEIALSQFKYTNYDLGIIISFSNLKVAKRITTLCDKLWLDSTDSIIHTRLLGLGRFRFTSYLLGLREFYFSMRLRNSFEIITYISSLDRYWDRILFRHSTKLVIPNLPIAISSVVLNTFPREIFFVGDINYNANRKAIRFIFRCLKSLNRELNANLYIVTGTSKYKKLLTWKGIPTSIHFLDNINAERMYHSNAIHIAPIWNSVGIKNKVSEPASLGIKVIGGVGSFNGLVTFPHMISVKSKREFLKVLIYHCKLEETVTIARLNVVKLDETERLIRLLAE